MRVLPVRLPEGHRIPAEVALMESKWDDIAHVVSLAPLITNDHHRLTLMTARRSSKKRTAPPRKRGRDTHRMTAAQKGVIAVTFCACAAILLYPPWRDVWVNFEGFQLHAPLAYGFFWSPPSAVFPAARTLDGLRLGEETIGVLGIGMLLYWVLGKTTKR